MYLKWCIHLMSANPILTVNFFLTESGSEPVREWLKDMEKEDKKQIGEDSPPFVCSLSLIITQKSC